MNEERIREIARRKWEEEGRPDGAHERHWREAEEEHRTSTGTPQTMPSDHNSATSPPNEDARERESADEPSNDWPAADTETPRGHS